MNNSITVIGTCHYETKAYKIIDLYNKLCDIRPDVILMEYPIEIEPEIMQWMNNNWEKKPGLENTAVLKYLETHDIAVRPYDIRGRNDYFMKTKYFEIGNEVNKAYDAYFKSEHPNQLAIKYKRLMSRVGRMQREWNTSTLEKINSSDCDLVTRTDLAIHDSVFSAILDLVPELKRFKPALLRQDRYEVKRNKAMVTNILNYNKQYEDKHLVVLCGYYHRYSLVGMLSRRQKSDHFILMA